MKRLSEDAKVTTEGLRLIFDSWSERAQLRAQEHQVAGDHDLNARVERGPPPLFPGLPCRFLGRMFALVQDRPDSMTAAAPGDQVKYTLLIYESSKDFESRHQGSQGPYVAAWRAYHKALVEAGAYVGGAPLKEVATATTVRAKDGKRLVQDGPFAEAKEQLGGFIILELPSLDSALSWAARCPAAATGAVEVRPMDADMHDTICGP